MPPIPITKSEYEARFGVAPAPQTKDTFDTTPAPVRVTRAEWEQLQQKWKPMRFDEGKDTSWLQNPISASIDRIKDIPSDVKEYFGNVKDTFQRAGIKADNARFQLASGDISTGAAVTKQLGAIGMGGGDLIFDTLLGGAKLFTTPKTEAKAAEVFGATGDQAGQYIKTKWEELKASEDPKDQEIAQEIQSLVTDYQTNPEFQALVDGYGGIGAGVLDLLGLKAFEDVGSASLKTLGTYETPDMKWPTLGRDVTEARERELFDIETRYGATRKANEYSKDNNAASRRRIAEANIWDDAVDADGKLDTKSPGQAYDQYRAATIEGREGVVRELLVRENATVNIAEIERALKLAVAESGLEGADLVTALKGIKKEIEGLRLRADGLDEIPLYKVQDAKISTTAGIDFNTPPNVKSYRKAVARTYKEVVENKSKTNVKDINKELQKYYQDLELIENLNGRRVKGGRLGKYFAQTAGTLIGVAGGSAGGPVTSAIAGIVGGEVAARLKGVSMSRTLGKGGKDIPTNPVLDAARKEAGLPPVKDLKTPDKVVGAPKNVPKTKEITKLEGQIKRNVKQQKTAIKAGDFALVAELKEIYALLVDKLKALIKEYNELSPREKQGGFIKNPLVRDKVEQYRPSDPRGRNLNAEAKALLEKGGGDPTGMEVIRTYLANKGGSGITRTELATAIDIVKGKAKKR